MESGVEVEEEVSWNFSLWRGSGGGFLGGTRSSRFSRLSLVSLSTRGMLVALSMVAEEAARLFSVESLMLVLQVPSGADVVV